MSFKRWYWQLNPPALFIGWPKVDQKTAKEWGMQGIEDVYPGCHIIESCGQNPHTNGAAMEVFMRQVNPYAEYLIKPGEITTLYYKEVLRSAPKGGEVTK